MRRKSRILLCFAVLWVLGIAYYFYSGAALSRKVGFRSPTVSPPVHGLSSCPDGSFPAGQSENGAATPPSLSRWGFRFLCNCIALRNLIKGRGVCVGRHWFGGDECGVVQRGWPVCTNLLLCRLLPYHGGEKEARPDARGEKMRKHAELAPLTAASLIWRACQHKLPQNMNRSETNAMFSTHTTKLLNYTCLKMLDTWTAWVQYIHYCVCVDVCVCTVYAYTHINTPHTRSTVFGITVKCCTAGCN